MTSESCIALGAMSEFVEPQEILDLIRASRPMLDVRAPVEVARAAMPNSVNLPLLVDTEREQIGTTYRYQGRDAAIDLGYQLVSGAEKSARVDSWVKFVERSQPAALFCARGGLRSKISQAWLGEVGIQLPRVRGGYKVLRRTLLEAIAAESERNNFIVVSGKTGSGKTKLLQTIAPRRAVVDLEGLARHRGSAFGKVYGEQPSQATFENALAGELVKLSTGERREIVLESESRRIGFVEIPKPLFRKMGVSSVVVVDESFDNRVSNILEDYVEDVSSRFVAADGVELGFERFEEFLASSVLKNEQRLGNERSRALVDSIKRAIQAQRLSGELEAHREWIAIMLKEYYDPFYERHLKSYADRVIFRGTFDEVVKYL